MKSIKHHRVLTYLLQERSIDSYAKMRRKAFRSVDLITGSTGWCDFLGENEWGEIVLVHQEELPVQWLRTSLFSIDVAKVEEKYQIQVDVDPTSLPSPLKPSEYVESPTIRLDTHAAIVKALENKLNKVYHYQQKGFSDKGTLILTIHDPNFGGFDNDLEIRCNTLDLAALKALSKNLAPMSSFRNILLVDGLVPFETSPSRRTYEPLP